MEKFFKCKGCLNDFDTKERIPYNILPCQHIACEVCTKQMQEQGNLCKFHHEQPAEIKDCVIQIQMMEEIKKNFGIIIHCRKHPTRPAEFFQMDQKTFICSHCAILEQDRSKLIAQSEEAVLQQGNLIFDYACQLEKKVEQFKKFGQTLKSGNLSYSGDEIFSHIYEALKCFNNFGIQIDDQIFQIYKKSINEGLKKEFRSADIQAKMETICQDIQTFTSQNNQSIDKSEEWKKLRQSAHVMQNSTLLCFQYAKKIDEWLLKRYEFVNLLFKGSIDGFDTKVFHEKCDNKGPTLTIVKTTTFFYFGGFTSRSWKQSNQNIEDKEAFIFSLTHQTKHSIIVEKSYSAIYDSAYFPCFGPRSASYLRTSTEAFTLDSGCNENMQNARAPFGYSYEPPKWATPNSKDLYDYLAGQCNFQVEDIEVFQLRDT